ncbi:hypothetical protein K461DRAFT_313817 [Myriangium duriaei CBS 260.36]|uniref:Uncharacterized protein n=1 Tax=Myriangium duriaei CBS 260.36 TaxID=1168546 RepID=A0A9P4MGF4_9PEZI|nr:hypothetical protein K461DRAFT_313817 [Myriangium duriaei CBS 260.36]
MHLRRLIAGAIILPYAHAFNIEFWGESNCAGAPVGTFNGGTNQGCQQLVIGTAEGAIITADSSDDGTVVVFYSSDNCDLETVVGESDNGCIAIDSFASQYKSFNVIPSAGQGRSRVMNTVAENPYGYEHGKLATYGNVTYRWHQIGANGWQGISPEQWDDHVHVKSYESIDTTTPTQALARRHSRDISIREPSTLYERNFVYASCARVVNCALAVIDGSKYHLGEVARGYAIGVENRARGQAIWGFLNNPVVLAYTVQIGGAAISGAISAITTNRIQASSCSTRKTDVDAIVSAINDGASQHPERAISTTISLAGGGFGTIRMEAVPTGQRGDGNTCGAPSTDPSSGGRKLAII